MKQKLSKLSLLILISSMIISVPLESFAYSQADSLIDIAVKARDQIGIQLAEMDDVSSELKAKFEKGSSEIELLKAAKDVDVPTARKHFLSAMEIFKEISQKVSQQSKLAETAQVADKSQKSTDNEIDRLEVYVKRLENIASKNQVDVDFSKVKSMINSARNNSEDVSLDQIKRAILDLNNSLREKTSVTNTKKAKSFAETYLKELDRLIVQAEDMRVSQSTIDRLIEARNNLDEAADVEQIIREVKHIISVKAQFEDTKIQRIKSRINQLESEINRLSETVDAENPELRKAHDMLSELPTITSNNPGEAIRMINSLNDLISQIENSIQEVSVSSDKKETDSMQSLGDSKSDRIKIKIERLESQLNKLSESIQDNAALKRWIENGLNLLKEAESFYEDSPQRSLEIIDKVEQIVKRVEKTMR